MDYYGSGDNHVESDSFIDDNGKLSECTIIVNALYDGRNGFLLKRALFNNLYHELNHAYVLYSQLKSSENNVTNQTTYYNQVSRTEYITAKICEKFMNEEDPYKNIKLNFLNRVNYRLFNDMEMNALVEGVYGDLKSFDRENEINELTVKDIIKKAQAYSIYCSTKNEKRVFFKIITEDEKKSVEEMFQMTIYEFERKIDSTLDELLRRIYRVASLFLDSQKDLKEYKNKVIFRNS